VTIIWDDNLKTGISIIDDQHQSLFAAINKLNSFNSDKALFLEALVELQIYVFYHFKTEEDYMVYVNYPEFQSHKKAHDDFVKNYRSVVKKFNNKDGIEDLSTDLINLFETWVKKHYSDEDVKMAEFLNKSKFDAK